MSAKSMIFRSQAIEMVEDVREAFGAAVRGLQWMDSGTRLKTLQKLSAIRNFVAFPAWLLESDRLDRHYQHVSINSAHIPYTHTAFIIAIVNILL